MFYHYIETMKYANIPVKNVTEIVDKLSFIGHNMVVE